MVWCMYWVGLYDFHEHPLEPRTPVYLQYPPPPPGYSVFWSYMLTKVIMHYEWYDFGYTCQRATQIQARFDDKDDILATELARDHVAQARCLPSGMTSWWSRELNLRNDMWRKISLTAAEMKSRSYCCQILTWTAVSYCDVDEKGDQ